MKSRDNTPGHYEQSKQQRIEPILQPIDISLQKYPPHIRINYPRLIKKDLHLAEIYRLAAEGTLVTPSERKLNPLQTKVDGKGRVWVDVIMERKKGVKIRELKRVMQVHGKPGRSRLVSGRVKVDNLPILNEMAKRLQTARPVVAALNKSLKVISANRTKLANEGFGNIDGSGVIVGIVDIGCDVNHPNFRKDGQTRLLFLWDQNGKKGAGKHQPANYDYGIEYDRTQIEALATSLRTPSDNPDYRLEKNAHGTHVMDIAAGSSPNPEYLGVAPGADLIFVDLGMPTTEEEIAAEEMKTLGSSKYLFDAVKYIFEKADILEKPAVVNISLATNGGSHDGTSLLETLFDELLKKPGHAIVIAAGNEYEEKSHRSGTVSSDRTSEIAWVIPKATDPEWKFRQELEIWYPLNKALSVEVFTPPTATSPTPTSLGTCGLGEAPLKSDESDTAPLWLISNSRAEPEIDKDENYIHALVDNSGDGHKGGEWLLKLSVEGAAPGEVVTVDFHAWIERNMGKPPNEFADLGLGDRGSTINGIGNATMPLVVGSFYLIPGSDTYIPSLSSSAGPSLNQQCPKKPELSAPGENISSAQALDDDLFDLTGTSAAAPHVAGIVALMFQKALPKKLKMQEISDILKATADRDSSLHNPDGYHPQLGFGRVNAMKALKKIT